MIRALETVRPTLRSQHGDVELLGVDEGRVRVRVVGNSAVASVIERAVLDAAPDVVGIEMEGVTEQAPVVGFISLESLRGADSNGIRRRTMAALSPGA